MSTTYESIPPFQGNLSPEDAINWLQRFVEATAMLNDSGIFRLLSTKFSHGSLARKWFDDLEDNIKTSWMSFERQFHARWVTTPRIQAEEDNRWKEFCSHELTYEMVFAHDPPDAARSDNIVIEWAKSQLRLGRATGHTDLELIAKTGPLLPAFIQANMEVIHGSDHSNFDDYCDKMKRIPYNSYRIEWLRHQRLLKEMHPFQGQIKQISEKVDSILATVADFRTNIGVPLPLHPSAEVARPDGSVTWEPCSPLTSVASTDDLSVASTSDTATPIVEQIPLSIVAEAAEVVLSNGSVEEDALFVAPRHWRKPVSLLSRKDRMDIVEKAIDFGLKFGSRISSNQASSANSGVAIYDRLTGRQAINGSSRALFSSNGSPEALWHCIEMIHHYLADGHPFNLDLCREMWGQFVSIRKVAGNLESHYIYPERPFLEVSWSNSNIDLHKQPSGSATMGGSLCKIYQWDGDIRIVSDKTVLFMTLSSYLAECTSDPGIMRFAIQSAACIKNYMLDSERELVKSCEFDAKSGGEKPGGTVSCYLTGICIEGLSVLGSVTGDKKWTSLALSIAEAAINTRSWHGSDGILSVGSDGDAFENDDNKTYKGLFLRGLMVVYQRNPSNKSFRQMVRSYINVQYNALRDLACRQNSYGVNWMGPYIGPYPHGQMAALDTLIASIGVNDS